MKILMTFFLTHHALRLNNSASEWKKNKMLSCPRRRTKRFDVRNDLCQNVPSINFFVTADKKKNKIYFAFSITDNTASCWNNSCKQSNSMCVKLHAMKYIKMKIYRHKPKNWYVCGNAIFFPSKISIVVSHCTIF